jgi:UDP-N-acetylmuramoyl-L-alanyl-D-glutamate--2,6-diaminopimelate ligase
MKLQEFVNNCKDLTCRGNIDLEISMVCSDSRCAEPGALFIAIEGYKDNGVKYLKDAVHRGAVAVVVEERFRTQVEDQKTATICYTGNARKCAIDIARIYYKYPSESFTLIGVTGTNGKTTITYLLEAILKEEGLNPGVIGTVSYRYRDVVKKANITTPDPIHTQSLFSEMREGGVSHVVMEVSSHALAMDRIKPQDFNCAVFTNLSQDHLDFHESMEEYFKAKSMLFTGLKSSATAIINSDDYYGKKLLSLTRANVRTFGIHSRSDFTGEIRSLSINGTEFTVNGSEFKIWLAGEHNVCNFLAAYAAGKVYDISDDTISAAISKVKSIPGRFERIDEGNEYHVFVDYAHTPDALDHLLDAANSLKRGRIITVFGCGGDRDRGKRPLMGHVVESKSDFAIVTSDNPRTEDPYAIIEDIRKGIKGTNHVIIPDRREAIFRAIELAQKEDIVLIAGKGHEDYQILRDRTIHFDDRKVAREAMAALGK